MKGQHYLPLSSSVAVEHDINLMFSKLLIHAILLVLSLHGLHCKMRYTVFAFAECQWFYFTNIQTAVLLWPCFLCWKQHQAHESAYLLKNLNLEQIFLLLIGLMLTKSCKKIGTRNFFSEGGNEEGSQSPLLVTSWPRVCMNYMWSM